MGINLGCDKEKGESKDRTRFTIGEGNQSGEGRLENEPTVRTGNALQRA